MNLTLTRHSLELHGLKHLMSLDEEMDIFNDLLPGSVWLLETPEDIIQVLKDPYIQQPVVHFEGWEYQGELQQVFSGIKNAKLAYHWTLKEPDHE